MKRLYTFLMCMGVLCAIAKADDFSNIVMVGSATETEITAEGSTVDDDERAAYQWFKQNNTNGTYISAEEIANGNTSIPEGTKVVWVMLDRVKNSNATDFVNNLKNENDPLFNANTINALKAYYEAGGSLYLSNHATQLITEIERINITPGTFGSGDGGYNGDVWTISPNNRSDHDVFSGLSTEGNPYGHLSYPMIGAGHKEDHNSMWYFDNVDDFQNQNNAVILATWGQNTTFNDAGMIEFLPSETKKGTIIANGLAACEWNRNDGTNPYRSNLERLTSNALNYLTTKYVAPQGGENPGDEEDPYVEPTEMPTLDNHITYMFDPSMSQYYGYDRNEAQKIAAVAEEHEWQNSTEWNYVYNKVAFVGWYETAKQFLEADDVDDDEKAACEWALQQGATYIPATAIIDMSFDLSMFDAFWINVDFDESNLPTLHGYYSDNKYTDAEKALLNYEGPFNTIYNPEGGVHRQTDVNTTGEDQERLKRILMAHTAGMSTDNRKAVGVENSLFSDNFIKALKLRHQLGWNMLLTSHASFLMSYIDRYADNGVRRYPRRWNFKKGAMVDREGYPINVDGTDVPTYGRMSVAYGQLEILYHNPDKADPDDPFFWYQDWPGTVDMTRVGIDHERLNDLLAGKPDRVEEHSYKKEFDVSNLSVQSPVNDALYKSNFSKFLYNHKMTGSRQNRNIYRGMTFESYDPIKVEVLPAEQGGDHFPDYVYRGADQYDPKYLKMINLFNGAVVNATDDHILCGQVNYRIYNSSNMENHNAYFAIDRFVHGNIDDNWEPSKWADLYYQSSIEPLATRPDIADYCMGTLIRWYPTDQEWRSQENEEGIILPGNLSNVIVDRIEAFRGKAFTMSMPGYEWNPSQTFQTWYTDNTALSRANNGYDTPFDPEQYVDAETARPANSAKTAAANGVAPDFDRKNIEQLTHNTLYELVRQKRDTEVSAAAPAATPYQLLEITDAGKSAIGLTDERKCYITYSANSSLPTYIVSGTDERPELTLVNKSAEEIATFIVEPKNVIWTSDYYVVALDADEFESKVSNPEGFSLTVTPVVNGTNGTAVSTVRTVIANTEGEAVYGTYMRRDGDLKPGVFSVKMSYINNNISYKPTAQALFSPVMPTAYNVTYTYEDELINDKHFGAEMTLNTFSTVINDDNELLEIGDDGLATETGKAKTLKVGGLKHRHMDCIFSFHRPNVSKAILDNYTVFYDLMLDNNDEDFNAMADVWCYDDNDNNVAIDRTYQVTVHEIHPTQSIFPIFIIKGTVYVPNSEVSKPAFAPGNNAGTRATYDYTAQYKRQEYKPSNGTTSFTDKMIVVEGKTTTGAEPATVNNLNVIREFYDNEENGMRLYNYYVDASENNSMGNWITDDGDNFYRDGVDGSGDKVYIKPMYYDLEVYTTDETGNIDNYYDYGEVILATPATTENQMREFFIGIEKGSYPENLIESRYAAKDFTTDADPVFVFTPVYIFERTVTPESHKSNDLPNNLLGLKRFGATEAPAQAPRRAEEADTDGMADETVQYVVIRGGAAVYDTGKEGNRPTLTGISGLKDNKAIVKGGIGYLDIKDTDNAQVFSASGMLVAMGNGHHQLPAGVYLVRTAATTYRVMVR